MADRRMTLFDTQLRRAHLTLLIVAGLESSALGLLSFTQIHEEILARWEDALAAFPAYVQYLSLAAFLAFFGGVLFVLFPVRFTVLVAHILVGMAVLYTIIAASGIFQVDRIAFIIVYLLTALCVLLARYREVEFYFKKTRYDGPIAIVLGSVFVLWAVAAGIGGISS